MLMSPADKIYRGDMDKNNKGFQNITSLDFTVSRDVGVTFTYFGAIQRGESATGISHGASDDTMQCSLRYRLIKETPSLPTVYAGYAQRVNGGSYAYGMVSKLWKKLLGQDTSFYCGATREINNVDNPVGSGDPSPRHQSTWIWGGIMRPVTRTLMVFLEFDGMGANVALHNKWKDMDLEIKAFDLQAAKLGFSVGYSFNLRDSEKKKIVKPPGAVRAVGKNTAVVDTAPRPDAPQTLGRGGMTPETAKELGWLAKELAPELRALGVRIGTLEERLPTLDDRVSGRERLKFGVEVNSSFVSQGFANRGQGTWNDHIGRLPAFSPGENFGVELFLLRSLTAKGAVWPGMFDYQTGRPYTNGTGFTAKAVLSVAAALSDRLDADARFSAFVSQGDPIVDAIWGTPADWLSNVHMSGRIAENEQGQANTPWTRMTLDSFTLEGSRESRSDAGEPAYRVTFGSLAPVELCRHIYAGIFNPAVNGPAYYGGFGLDVRGALGSGARGEILWTKIPDGAMKRDATASNSYPSALGGHLAWSGGNASAGVSFLRASSSDFSGTAAVPGSIAGVNGVWVHWVNPPGHTAAEIADPACSPIAPSAGGFGDFGPQAVTMWGGTFTWKVSDRLSLSGDYGSSRYWPNMQSSYTRDGSALRVALAFTPPRWNIGVDYISVEPTYDPMINQFPGNRLLLLQEPEKTGLLNTDGIGGMVYRFPSLDYFPIGFALHDTELFPHNRQGFRFGVSRTLGGDGALWAQYGALRQVRTSAPDVRIPAGSGLAPGFIDPVFFMLKGQDSDFNPLEDTRGQSVNWGAGAAFTVPESRLRVDISFNEFRFRRDASLAANQNDYVTAESNFVDFTVNRGSLRLAYPVAYRDDGRPRFTLRGGYEWGAMRGHWDPAGTYSTMGTMYAQTHNSYTFTNIDTAQNTLSLGFDYAMSSNAAWNLDFKFIDTQDYLPVEFPLPLYHHPYAWRGLQVTSQVNVKL